MYDRHVNWWLSTCYLITWTYAWLMVITQVFLCNLLGIFQYWHDIAFTATMGDTKYQFLLCLWTEKKNPFQGPWLKIDMAMNSPRYKLHYGPHCFFQDQWLMVAKIGYVANSCLTPNAIPCRHIAFNTPPPIPKMSASIFKFFIGLTHLGICSLLFHHIANSIHHPLLAIHQCHVSHHQLIAIW